MWFNGDTFKKEFAKELINHGSKRQDVLSNDAGNIILNLAKNGDITNSSYESFYDSPWANSVDVEIEHWKIHQVNPKKTPKNC